MDAPNEVAMSTRDAANIPRSESYQVQCYPIATKKYQVGGVISKHGRS